MSRSRKLIRQKSDSNSTSLPAIASALMLSLVVGCANQNPPASLAADTTQQFDSQQFDSQQVDSTKVAVTTTDSPLATEYTESIPATQKVTETIASDITTGLTISVIKDTHSDTLQISGLQSNPKVLTLESPNRIVIDIPATKTNFAPLYKVESDTITSLRIGTKPTGTRLVFDVKSALPSQTALNDSKSYSDGTLFLTFPGYNSAETLSKVTSAPEIIASSSPASTSVEPTLPAVITGKLEKLELKKTEMNAGEVALELNSPRPFELTQTTSTEYSLMIPNTVASETTRLPQIAPAGKAGIRSARAVQQGEDVLVRMFVDSGVELDALPNGSKIIVAPLRTGASTARGQLATPESTDKKEVQVNDEVARRNPTGIPSSDGAKNYVGRLISLDLQETDIDNALRIIAEVSNLNIIASDDVSGKVTLRLIDVPWDQALDVILKTNGLDQVTEGNVIRIAPVDKLRQEREGLLEAKKAAENLEDLKVSYIRISYARATDMKEQVESVLSERGSVAVDERTNQIIVKDIQKGQEQIAQLIRKLDLRTPQVLLETQIVEASHNFLRDLGFQWNFSYAQSPATGNATGLNFPNSVIVGGGNGFPGQTGTLGQAISFPAAVSSTAGSAINFVLDSADGSRSLGAVLSALENDNKIKVISRPQVATINNKPAEIKSVETVRVRLPSSGLSVATGSGASAQGGASSAFEEIPVGIELKVTPQASPDNYVLMDIFAKSKFLQRLTVLLPLQFLSKVDKHSLLVVCIE
jgi:type IV pilus assembly protein PilQ